MSTIANLDELCNLDGRPIGDHTMREWAEHTEHRHTDLDYEDVPGNPFESIDLDGETLAVADTITARATLLTGQAGKADIRVPCLVLDFLVGQMGGAPGLVTRIGLIAPPETMRRSGKLLRDTANGAANAGERAA